MMKLARALTVLAILVFAFVGVGSALLEPRAVLAQRIDPHSPDLAIVLGEAGTPIGSPQRLLIFDERAFLPGNGPENSRLVSDTYLTQNGIYPLQWKTVEFVRNVAFLASGFGALLMGLTWWWLGKRSSGTARAPQRTA